MASEHDIIVVDDHPLFRRGVIQLLKMDPSFNVVAEAGDFEAAMVAVRGRDPDIVLLDLNMKHTSGVEILTAIKAFNPSIRVIMLTVSDSPFPTCSNASKTAPTATCSKIRSRNRFLKTFRKPQKAKQFSLRR